MFKWVKLLEQAKKSDDRYYKAIFETKKNYINFK